MAYKVYVKKLSSYEKKRKQARHDRRQAKRLASTEMPELTKAQIDEMLHACLERMHTRIQEVVKADYPELLSLIGSDISITMCKFAETGSQEALKTVLGRCEAELEEFGSIVMLGIVTGALKGTTE